MFRSLSRCTPNSPVTLAFTSSKTQYFNIWSNVTVSINSTVTNTRPIRLNSGDLVQVTITTPPNYLGHAFYPYTLEDLPYSFAVVNRNNFTPTVKSSDARKRWYNYVITNYTISFPFDFTEQDYGLGFGRKYIDVDSLNIVLDPIRRAVVFYLNQQNICRVVLPDFPVSYKKIPGEFPEGTYTQELLVLCANGRLYRIRFNTAYVFSDEFKPVVLPVTPLDDLPYLEDVPNQGSFMDIARARFLRSLNPVVSALDTANNEIWLAGSNTVYVTNMSFVTQSTFTIGAEQIVDLVCFNNNAVVITKSQKALSVQRSGGSSLLVTAAVLGSPCSFDNGQRLAIPDCNNRRILVYDTAFNQTIWNCGDFVPAYCQTFDNYVYVTGHDDNRVLRFDSSGNYSTVYFNRKVTLVSVTNGAMIAMHCLQNFNTLNKVGIKKVIPFQLGLKTGPISLIGSTPLQIRMLGQESIYAVPGPYITCWVNGRSDAPLNTGDYFSVSYTAQAPGMFRSNFIIGENAFDFDVIVVSSASLEDHFKPGTSIENIISIPFSVIEPPDYNNIDNGLYILDLGFGFKYFGNTYTQLGITTNGYLTFNFAEPVDTNPNVSTSTGDRIYVYPEDLLTGLPYSLVNPIGTNYGVLDSGETPGVYFKPFSSTEFQGLKVRWVGTSHRHYPYGNTQSATTTTVSWAEVPVVAMGNVFVGDYAKGPGITVSTTVLAKTAYTANLIAYRFQGNSVYITTQDTTVKRYSNVIVDGVTIGYVHENNYTTLTGTKILAQQANTILVNGQVNSNVVNNLPDYLIRINGRGLIDATGITLVTDTVTTIWPTVNSNYLVIDSVDYAKLYSGLTLNSVDFGNQTIANLQTISTVVSITVNRSYFADLDTVTVSFTTNYTTARNISYTITSVDSITNEFDPVIPLSGNITVSTTGSFSFTIGATRNAPTAKTISVAFSNFGNVDNATRTFSLTIMASGQPVPIVNLPQTQNHTFNEYRAYLSNTISVALGTSVNYTVSEINFATVPVISLVGNISYERNYLVVSNSVPTYTVPKPLVVTGNFVRLSSNISASTTDVYRFKPEFPAPAYTYEVGFYQGKNYQYIELYYDNLNARTAVTGGVTVSNQPARTLTFSPAPNLVTTFASWYFTGAQVHLGSGCFTTTFTGFAVRELDWIRVAPELPNFAKFEAYIEQKIPAGANIMASINFGYIGVDGIEDTKALPVLEGNLITVSVPLRSNAYAVTTLVSIGDYQMSLPSTTEWAKNNFINTKVIQTDRVAGSLSNISAVVPISGDYVIPLYYRSSTESVLNPTSFTVTRNSVVSNLTPGLTYTLLTNDVITVNNLQNSRRVYDTRTIMINGASIIQIIGRTSSGSVFDNINFGVLESPYTRYYDYVYTAGNLEYSEKDLYTTSNITLTSAVPMAGSFSVPATGITVYVNGAVVANRYNFSVNTGANISLKWNVPNYFQSNAIIYQRKTESYDTSVAFVPIGIWSINNRSVINSPVLNSQPTIIKHQPEADLVTAFTWVTSELGNKWLVKSSSPANKLQQQYQQSLENIAVPQSALYMSTASVIHSNMPVARLSNLQQYIQNIIGQPQLDVSLVTSLIVVATQELRELTGATTFINNAKDFRLSSNFVYSYIKYALSEQLEKTGDIKHLRGITVEKFLPPGLEVVTPGSQAKIDIVESELLADNKQIRISRTNPWQFVHKGIDQLRSGNQVEFEHDTSIEKNIFNQNEFGFDITKLGQSTEASPDRFLFQTLHDADRIEYDLNPEFQVPATDAVFNVTADSVYYTNFLFEFVADTMKTTEFFIDVSAQPMTTNPWMMSIPPQPMTTNPWMMAIPPQPMTTNPWMISILPQPLPYNQFKLPMVGQLNVYKLLKFSIDSKLDQPEPILPPIDPVLEKFPKSLIPLAPELQLFSSQLIPIDPLLAKINITEVNFDPELQKVNLQFVDLPSQLDKISIVPVKINYVLDQEPLWEMSDWTQYGSEYTDFLTYADNGRGGDNLLNKGSPPSRLPFVPYTANTGSTLLAGVQHGIFHLHSGNVISYINGTVYHYDVEYKDSLIKANTCVTGSGSVTGYSTNTTANIQDQRILDIDPFEQLTVIWNSQSSGSVGNQGGGWTTGNITVDPGRLYRSSVWVRRISANSAGYVSHGISAAGELIDITNGTAQSNAVWSQRPVSDYAIGQWYLHVGYVYPSDYEYNVPQYQGGIYDVYGTRVMSNQGNIPVGAKFPVNTTQVQQKTYFNNISQANVQVQFAYPKFEEVTGTNVFKNLIAVPSSSPLASNAYTVVGSSLSFGSVTGQLTTVPGRDYGPGSQFTLAAAQTQADRYYRASPIKILATDYWNYRIHFTAHKYSIRSFDPVLNYEKIIAEGLETLRMDYTSVDPLENLSYRIEPVIVNTEYVLAGGGGGGGANAGGGGGGGMVYTGNVDLSPGIYYPVIIGEGGLGGNVLLPGALSYTITVDDSDNSMTLGDSANVIVNSALSIENLTYSVEQPLTVGEIPGASTTVALDRGQIGQLSLFVTIEAPGGGGGGAGFSVNINGTVAGGTGGGGGSDYTNSVGGTGAISTYDLNGGNGTRISGGGGGGTGAAGTAASIFSTVDFAALTGITVTSTLPEGIGRSGDGGPGREVMESCWLLGAGGGGGSYFYSNSAALFSGNGGLYGGGNGGTITSSTGQAGAANSGGGGGGGFAGFSGGNGGRGVLILKYDAIWNIYIRGNLTAETRTLGNSKLTVFTQGEGEILFWYDCSTTVKRICYPRKGKLWPIEWLIRGG